MLYQSHPHLAEGVGFEPTVRLPVRLISSQLNSPRKLPLPSGGFPTLNRQLSILAQNHCTADAKESHARTEICRSPQSLAALHFADAFVNRQTSATLLPDQASRRDCGRGL
jgi:hypothetical protein